MARGQRGIRKNAKYNCDQCGQLIEGLKAYYIWQHQRQNPNRRGFCSRECSFLSKKIKKVELECKTCKVKFERLPSDIVSKNSFCSQTCAGVYNNRLYVKRRTLQSGDVVKKKGEFSKVLRECFFCQGRFEVSGHNRKFCSLKCSSGHRKYEQIKKWQETGEMRSKSGQLSLFVRRYILEKYGNKCSKCDWSEINEVTGKSPLEIDHIDGDSRNNKEENLRLLCPNCHALTPTYKALNKGRGRHKRMDRYREGKSY